MKIEATIALYVFLPCLIGIVSTAASFYLADKMPNLNSLKLYDSLYHYIERWTFFTLFVIHITLWPVYWLAVFCEFLTRGVDDGDK